MLKLLGTDGSRLYDFDLTSGTHDVGRVEERAICIPHKTISRKHAVIEVAAEGEPITITDTGSHNGTAVNDRRISSPTVIKAGDRIMFGGTDFRVKEAGETDPVVPKPTLLAEDEPEKSVFMPLNEALQPLPAKVTELPELFNTVSEMARTLDMDESRDEMLERSLKLVNKVIQAERLAILMTDEESGDIYSAATLLPTGKDPGSFRLSRTIAGQILTDKNAILIGNPEDDPRFAQQESIIMSDLRSAMAVPLFDAGKVLGILYVDTSNPMHRYTDDYLRVLATFGNIIAARLLNYEQLEERQEKKIIDAELKRASGIQQALLIKDIPDVPGYAVWPYQKQCRSVGGDLYDIVTLPDGRVVLVVADVSGKGMGAALLMSNILASFRILYNVSEFTLGEVVNLVSAQLYRSSAPADFATLFVGVLSPEENRMAYINAGHNPPVLLRADGSIEHLDANGIMIGAFDIGSWGEGEITMNPADLLFVFSDGVTEADRGDELFSDERLEKALGGYTELEPKPLVEQVMADIDAFLDGAPKSDDITMLALKRNS